MVASEIKSSLVGKCVVFNNGIEGKVTDIIKSDGCIGIKVERIDNEGNMHTYIFSKKTKNIDGFNVEKDWDTLANVSLK